MDRPLETLPRQIRTPQKSARTFPGSRATINVAQRTEQRRQQTPALATGDADLSVANVQLRILEQERQRLARDLHDEAGHLITAAILRLDRALSTCAATEALRYDMQEIRTLLTDCANGIHDVAFRLRPQALTDLGLLPALQTLARRASHLSGASVAVSARGESRIGNPDVELAAFRIIQEALTNALKYASASRITIRLMQTPGSLMIRITDNGCGFDPAAVDLSSGHHFGLHGMRERARLAGGNLKVHSTPDRGTTIRAQFRFCEASS